MERAARDHLDKMRSVNSIVKGGKVRARNDQGLHFLLTYQLNMNAITAFSTAAPAEAHSYRTDRGGALQAPFGRREIHLFRRRGPFLYPLLEGEKTVK